MSKYEVSEKVFIGVCSLFSLIFSAFDWPICFINAAIESSKYGNTRKRFESTIRFIGYFVSCRAKYLAAGVLALINEQKSDELYEAGIEDSIKYDEYLDEVFE